MEGFEFRISELAHHGVKGMKWRRRRIRKIQGPAQVLQPETNEDFGMPVDFRSDDSRMRSLSKGRQTRADAERYAEECRQVLEREGDTLYEDLRIEKSVQRQVQQLTQAEQTGNGATRTKKLFGKSGR